ncbi:MAG: acyl--CoA ligase [Clostridia bacterium]|nr:acyl--CoA ligase [Clostridia bacterium]
MSKANKKVLPAGQVLIAKEKEKMAEQKLTGYPSIDKPWLKYYTEEVLALKAPECSVYRNIYENNKDYPNDTAILYFGNRISYGEMFADVETCAKSLKQIGIKEGDCVTLCSAGVPESIFMVLACSKIGAIANFINPLFTTEQMIDRINDTESEWIFILDAMFPYIEKALPKTCVKNAVIIPVNRSMGNLIKLLASLKSKTKSILKRQTPYRLLHWNEFEKLGTSYTGETEVPYKKDTPVIMVYSSGSTGASKGIMLTNDGINATLIFYKTPSFPYERSYSFLQMIPVWFSTGIVLSALMPLFLGVTVIPEPRFSKESFVRDVAKYKPSMTLTATSLWLYAIDSKALTNFDFSNMHYPITGGEKLLPQDEERINRFLRERGSYRQILKGYGMCELGSTITASTNENKYTNKLGGTGYPILGVSVSAFDMETNKELKYGEHGEIRVCSPARMKGYYKNEAATNEFFYTDENGQVWGCTGDIGYVDEDGEVFILGRATDSAVLDSGKKVYMFDIEDVILQEETLSGCKVVAVEENGKTVLAAHMTVRNGVNYDPQTLARKIYENCKNNLPAEEIPTKYKFRDSFPVHTNGKRDNNALKQETDGFIVIE